MNAQFSMLEGNLTVSRYFSKAFFFFAALSLLISSAAPSHADSASQSEDVISPFEVVYSVGNNMINAGSATLSLAREGDEWVYSLKTTPTGVFKLTGKGKIQEISVFNVISMDTNTVVQPQRYTYRQDEESRRAVDAWFDWDAQKLTYKRRGEEVTEAFSDPVLDRLSVTLAVMNELKRSGFEKAQMQVFDSGKVKTMDFLNEGVEKIDSTLGSMETIRVRSSAANGSIRHTYTWFAPALDFVPVRMEQYKRGKLVARLTLTSLKNRVTETGNSEAIKLDSKAQ